MTLEDRLERMLTADADRHRTARDGLARIRARVRTRRRRRRVGVGGTVVLLVAALVAGGVTLVATGSSRDRQRITVVGLPGPPSAETPGELVGVTATRVNVYSAATGRPVRSVQLSKRLRYGPQGQIGVDPAGETAYVAVVQTGVTNCPSGIVTVNTHTGAEHALITGASVPAVNPAGTTLAYLTDQGPIKKKPGEACQENTVTTENLRTGAKRSWHPTRPAAANSVSETINSLSWATDADLLVGSASGSATGIQILDTTKATSSTNPETVGASFRTHGAPSARYSNPVELADGAIVAFAPSCWGDMSCPTLPPSKRGITSIVTVNRVSGHATALTNLPTGAPVGLLTIPDSHELLAKSASNTSAVSIYRLTGSRLVALIRDAGLIAWASRARPAPPAPLDAHLDLDTVRPTAGTTIHGSLIIENHTSHAVDVHGCRADGWGQVGLMNRKVTYQPSNGAVACEDIPQLRPGSNRFNVTIATTYEVCTNTKSEVTPQFPECRTGHSPLPTLPAGTYRTSTYIYGIPSNELHISETQVVIGG